MPFWTFQIFLWSAHMQVKSFMNLWKKVILDAVFVITCYSLWLLMIIYDYLWLLMIIYYYLSFIYFIFGVFPSEVSVEVEDEHCALRCLDSSRGRCGSLHFLFFIFNSFLLLIRLLIVTSCLLVVFAFVWRLFGNFSSTFARFVLLRASTEAVHLNARSWIAKTAENQIGNLNAKTQFNNLKCFK